jgi:phosphonate metabolism-associated iron-containing alcohol dehydrogenase
MPDWQYHNPVKIHFGPAIIRNLPHIVGPQRSILITTPGFTKRGNSNSLKKLLGGSLVAIFDGVQPNPTFSSIKEAFNELQQYEYEAIIALGGGSTIDTAKAVAASGASGSELWIDNHLKHGAPFPELFDPKPIIAIPTTAGTGSEITMWATVWDMQEKKKYSLSHPKLYPETALLDPELTLTLPEKETIYSGLDALSHAMEAIWNKNHNPISDTFALKAISMVYDYLPELRSNLKNSVLRTHLLRASLFAGLAFSNTKTALAHSISYPLTAHFGLPHGLACALPLPHLLRFNALKASERIEIMAEALRADTTAESMISEVTKLFEKIGLSPSLSHYGIDKSQVELIVNSAFTPGRADNNIAEFNEADIFNIINHLF